MKPSLNAATRAVRAGLNQDHQHGAVMPPIYLSSNFTFEGLNQPRQYDYTRSGNPTREVLAETIAGLEQGSGAVITTSGMSAVNLCLQLLRPGDIVVAPHDCYGGTHRLFSSLHKRKQLEVIFVDQTDKHQLIGALARNPKMVWVETPSNPLLRITNIARIAALGKRFGAIVAVDNTFLSPALQQPLVLGADLVVHSTTKYLNGHSDVVGGAVVAKDKNLFEELTWWANCLGITGAPFDSFLTLRGVRTLHARMKIHCENARILAEILQGHEAVRRVYYPGLPTHPGHETARGQQSDHGAIISFELSGGLDQVRTFVSGLRCFSLAESLGGVESLIAHPATMTHAAMPSEARARAGIVDGLLRISVGIEQSADLCSDLVRALDTCLEHEEVACA